MECCDGSRPIPVEGSARGRVGLQGTLSERQSRTRKIRAFRQLCLWRNGTRRGLQRSTPPSRGWRRAASDERRSAETRRTRGSIRRIADWRSTAWGRSCRPGHDRARFRVFPIVQVSIWPSLAVPFDARHTSSTTSDSMKPQALKSEVTRLIRGFSLARSRCSRAHLDQRWERLESNRSRRTRASIRLD